MIVSVTDDLTVMFVDERLFIEMNGLDNSWWLMQKGFFYQIHVWFISNTWVSSDHFFIWITVFLIDLWIFFFYFSSSLCFSSYISFGCSSFEFQFDMFYLFRFRCLNRKLTFANCFLLIFSEVKSSMLSSNFREAVHPVDKVVQKQRNNKWIKKKDWRAVLNCNF